jgi:hypothetical protein
MSKLVSAEQLAKMLADAAEGLTPREYTLVLEEVLVDTETSDVAKIASHMPPELQGLLPRKYLH